jgi:hypothetical protein
MLSARFSALHGHSLVPQKKFNDDAAITAILM